ncbi:ribonuclease HII [bacterium (Candidatus Gribaldobacteria) CG08_land_8_20_14_0_20_39_15]|uniref:Ribonuclease HII n=1 Tax=bacterium (Candidatus Gribaldobacteria) CG08_land_8_20_14_0_20_39_15 TaxID=2014273 RepID=A0A2M6XTQ2_9BACT|nr:MAG: ribonuclease HII [bacterium (Candidatus Gribaldobacteria) CG08_land_8_20_14_0_20_39_15]
MRYPNLRDEKKLWRKGFKRVACLDEAGRGPLAGPVVAAAVVLNSKFKIHNLKIKDSKKLTPKKREEFYKILNKNPAIEWGIGRVSEKVIDKINIKNAAELAMEKAIRKLKHHPDFLIIDGNHINSKKLKAKSYKLIVKADEKVFSCACASIIAKVTRDRIMKRYHKKYPQYGFDKHKGYPTKYHIKMLKKYGSCKIHRKSFKPVKNIVNPVRNSGPYQKYLSAICF